VSWVGEMSGGGEGPEGWGMSSCISQGRVSYQWKEDKFMMIIYTDIGKIYGVSGSWRKTCDVLHVRKQLSPLFAASGRIGRVKGDNCCPTINHSVTTVVCCIHLRHLFTHSVVTHFTHAVANE
jgi:hypothetical protein